MSTPISDAPVERLPSPEGPLRDGVAGVAAPTTPVGSPIRPGDPTSSLIELRLLALHRPSGDLLSCLECGLCWPCNTKRVLDGEVPFALDVAGWSHG